LTIYTINSSGSRDTIPLTVTSNSTTYIQTKNNPNWFITNHKS